MKLLGFAFKKISIEKLESNVELKDVKVGTHLDIKEVTEVDSSIFKMKDSALNILFDYSIDYAPNFAKLQFSGNVVLSVESKLAKEAMKSWKDKNLPEEIKLPVLNLIAKKSNVKALAMEDEFNLPLHVPMPSIQKVVDKK